MQTKLAVAVSGGVDSLCSLIDSVQSGNEVFAVHALFHEKNDAIIQGLEAACKTLQIPLHIIDLRQAFEREVIQPFIQAYKKGLTPNPCTRCNQKMKFGLLLDACLQLGADRMVTGHYASLHYDQEGAMLCAAKDSAKDQSYFLSLVSRDALSKISFPLAQRTKKEAIEKVRQFGLPVPSHKGSQEICFIPQGSDHYKNFLALSPEKGPVIFVQEEEEKQIGYHEGLWRYTEGQRKGLGISWKEPIYVIRKDMARNTLYVGTKEYAFMKGALLCSFNFMRDRLPEKLFARVRYRQQPALAQLEFIDSEHARLRLETPLALSAPGQIASISDEQGRIWAGAIMTHIILASDTKTTEKRS